MIRIRQLLTEITEDAATTKQAKALGLTSIGWGRWADKSGKVTHTSKDGKLTPVVKKAVEPFTKFKSDREKGFDKWHADIAARKAAAAEKKANPGAWRGRNKFGTNLSGDALRKWQDSQEQPLRFFGPNGSHGIAGALTQTRNDPNGEKEHKVITGVWDRVTSAVKDGENVTMDQLSKKTGLSPKALEYVIKRSYTDNPSSAGFQTYRDGTYSVHHGGQGGT